MSVNDGELGRSVTLARKSARLTQTELAEEMAERGHTAWRQTTVSRVEKGERPLRVTELVTLGEVLLPVSTLLAMAAGPAGTVSSQIDQIGMGSAESLRVAQCRVGELQNKLLALGDKRLTR